MHASICSVTHLRLSGCWNILELVVPGWIEQEVDHVLACLSKQDSRRTSDVCIECGIYTSSAVSFDDHECGAKHAAQLKLLAGGHSHKHKG